MTELTTDDWDDLNWFTIEREVFRIQRRIFDASRRSNSTKMHELQKLLLRSRNARLLAVRKATERSKGKHTPGIDGMKTLTSRQKMALANRLSSKWDTSPVLRKHIPKPGSTEKRPLGIPTIADRAHQHLLNFALDPQAEARYSPHQYGFRRGRSAHDAINSCRRTILRSPQWVMRLDIEKFFDQLDHDAILKKLETFPLMERAIRPILKSGAYEGSVLTEPESGTPQGGPLSPLLANTALCDLEAAVHSAFPPSKRINGHRVDKRPRVIIYADDVTIFHPNPEILKAIEAYISQWLTHLGLKLNSNKTTTSHTLEKHNGSAGFDFLGVHIQQFPVGIHQMKTHAYHKGAFTSIKPTKESMKRLHRKAKDIINTSTPHKRRNAERKHKEDTLGKTTPQELIIHRLNPVIRGWTNYHRPYNAKRAFSMVDYKLFPLLWKWCIRFHPRMSRKWLAKTLFNKANKTTPWHFKSIRTDKPMELLKASSVPIRRHIAVQSQRSYYDGDTYYWAKRSGRYPSLPYSISTRIKKQNGKCAHCNQSFTGHDKVVLQQFPVPDTTYSVKKAVHHHCAPIPSTQNSVQQTAEKS